MADDVLLFIGSREDVDRAVDYLGSNRDNPLENPARKDA
jgi:hypothetical protein